MGMRGVGWPWGGDVVWCVWCGALQLLEEEQHPPRTRCSGARRGVGRGRGAEVLLPSVWERGMALEAQEEE